MKLRSLGILVAIATLAQGAFASTFFFGDSLSDGGNVSLATSGATPGPQYYQGRFSNGLIWADHFAAHFGTTLAPSLAGGTDYAWGGATTGSGLSADGTPNVDTQIAAFAAGGHHFASDDIVSLWAGSNDFIQGQLDPAVPVHNLGLEIGALYALGARRILVPNMVELGYTPDLVNTPFQDPANNICLAFDSLLHTELGISRATHAGLDIYELDVNSLFLNVRSHASSYGISDITHSYLDSGSTADPNTFLFYDSLHPTAAVHALMGQAAIAAVPEPATLAAFGLGLGALLRRRRSK